EGFMEGQRLPEMRFGLRNPAPGSEDDAELPVCIGEILLVLGIPPGQLLAQGQGLAEGPLRVLESAQLAPNFPDAVPGMQPLVSHVQASPAVRGESLVVR